MLNSSIIAVIMARAEIKTKPTGASVEDFLNKIENEVRRADSFRVLEMFRRVTGEEPKMWGPSIVGFGSQVYRYPNGSEMDWMLAAFSPRKTNLTLYVVCGSPKQPELLAKLGKHSTSVSCLYIKRLSDVDEKVLESVIKDAVRFTREGK